MKENSESIDISKMKEIVGEINIFLRNFNGLKVQVRDASPKVAALWNHVVLSKGESFHLLFFFTRQNELNSFYENP